MRAIRTAPAAFAALLLVIASACADDAAQPIAPIETTTATTEVAATTAPTSTSAAPTTMSETTAPVTTAPVTTAPATTEPVSSEPTGPSNGVVVTPPFGDDPAIARWLVPWDDGFLAVGMDYSLQALPDELPPEIAELFPPEITELFPDGLPETRQEAIDIVEAADLYDELMAVINEHPEIMGALDTPAPMRTAWTLDGDEWAASQFENPLGLADPSALSATSDRLSLLGIEPPTDEAPAMITVATTVDLDQWTADRFDLATTDSDALATPYVWPYAFAANDRGWVGQFMVEDRTSENTSGEPGDVVFEEWGAVWGEQPERTGAVTAPGSLVATDAGYFAYDADTVRFSPDGTEWETLTLPAPSTAMMAAAPFEGGLVVLAGSRLDGMQIYQVDPTATNWQAIEHGLDIDTGWVLAEPTSPAFLIAEPTGDEPPPIWVLASGDATTWFAELYPAGDEGRIPMLAAANATTLLTGEVDWGFAPEGENVWHRYDLPG